MKSTTLGVMMFRGATSLSATDKQAFARTVHVCAGPTIGHPALPRAQTIRAGMFAGIGIRVEWIDVRACPPAAIHISISSPTSRVSLRLGFASKGGTTIWLSTTTTICGDGPRENWPNRKAHVYNHRVSDAKIEILG
jgi:hypothetical protein